MNLSNINSMCERIVVRLFGVGVHFKPKGTVTGLFIVLRGFNYRYPSMLCTCEV